MIQLKKTILTLVALLAVTTGAWADETLLLTIESKDNTSFKDGGSKTFDDKVIVTFSNKVSNDGDNYGWYLGGAGGALLTVAGTNGYTITSCKFYTDGGAAETGYTVEGESPSVYLSGGMVYTDDSKSVYIGIPGIKKIEVYTAPASGPEVAWNKAAKTGTFTMPGGNVTLEPEYYDQAALTAAPTAINDVPATTDGAIVKAGTVKNIGETTTAQGTVMYYVSPTALDDAALLALAADQWTADVPTAAHLAQGQAYVYYYVRGNDSDTDEENFSDGDISSDNVLQVTIAAAPTYAVTFAEGIDEPTKWTASPATGVTKGQTVTVTYTGTKKVLGVKAEKKAAPAATKDAKDATAEDLGKVVCAAGHLHDAKTPVPDGCTAVGILGKVTETGHGLILAMQNATEQTWTTINGWTSASYAGTTLKVLPDDTARGSLTSYTTLGETTVSNWAVAQKSDYDAIFENLGSTTGNDKGKTYDDNVNAYITTGVGSTAIDGRYWSATEDGGNYAWYFRSDKWSSDNKGESHNVRPVLGF